MQKHHVGLRDAAVAIVTGHFRQRCGGGQQRARGILCGGCRDCLPYAAARHLIFAGPHSCVPKLTQQGWAWLSPLLTQGMALQAGQRGAHLLRSMPV